MARIFRPGAKADCCLILEGPQGIRKSTALRTIAGDYFTDELVDLGSKDAAMQTRVVWIIELSELDNLGHAEVARIKAFMSRTTDRFRPPYEMRLRCRWARESRHGPATGSNWFSVRFGRNTAREHANLPGGPKDRQRAYPPGIERSLDAAMVPERKMDRGHLGRQ